MGGGANGKHSTLRLLMLEVCSSGLVGLVLVVLGCCGRVLPLPEGTIVCVTYSTIPDEVGAGLTVQMVLTRPSAIDRIRDVINSSKLVDTPLKAGYDGLLKMRYENGAVIELEVLGKWLLRVSKHGRFLWYRMPVHIEELTALDGWVPANLGVEEPRPC